VAHERDVAEDGSDESLVRQRAYVDELRTICLVESR